MALSPLTLTVSYGIVGSRFLSALNGRTAGSVLSVVSGSPGFDVVNGYLRNIALPYEADSVTVREYVPNTGESLDTTFTITAVLPSTLRRTARLAGGTQFRTYYTRAPDRSFLWAYAYDTADGGTATTSAGAAPVRQSVFGNAMWDDNALWDDSDTWRNAA